MQFQKGNIGVFFRGDPYLKGWWIFNGDTIDYSRHGFNGTINGSLPIVSERNRTSYYFNKNSANYINLGDIDISGGITILMWVKCPNTVGSQGTWGWISKDPIGSNGNYSFRGSETDIGFSFYCGTGSNSYWNCPVPNFADNHWHLIGFSMTFGIGSSAFSILDGKPYQGSWSGNSGDATPLQNNTNVYVGRYVSYAGSYSYNPFEGYIEETAIFNRRITPAHISQYYKWATGVAKRKYTFETIELPQPNFFPFF